jgi:hypothetical protein
MEIFGEWSFRGRGQQIAANRQQEAGSGTVSTVPFWLYAVHVRQLTGESPVPT